MTVTVDSLDVVLATRIPIGKNRGARLSDIVDGGAEGERWLAWSLALEPGAFEDDAFEEALEVLARHWHRLRDGDDA